jgi:tetratricopeptide (TPR) repeat protein
MLVLSRDYRPKLHAMLEALKQTGTKEDGSARALESAYGKSIEGVEKDLQSYMAANTLAAAVFDAPAVKPAGEVEIDKNAGMAARLALAELITVTPGKLAQARAAYNQLERDYPNRWPVEQAVADFDLRERRNSEAAEHYAIAAELGAKGPELYVRYARALSLTNRDDDAIKALRTAVSLDPAMDEAHLELGLGLVRAGQYREAVDQFGKIKRLDPERASRFYYGFAFASYKLGDRVRARTLIKEARGYTKNPEELAALDKLSEAVGR